MKPSTDYRDYVFKNGKFVGMFEEMYRNVEDVPWHQDKTAYWVFSDIDIAILRQFQYEKICEIGCGLGFFTNRLYRELRSPGGGHPDITGLELSKTAVNEASKLFQELRFVSHDILNDDAFFDRFDLIVMKELLWYVCHKIDDYFEKAMLMVKNGGYFYVSQSFPESDTWVGQDVVGEPEDLKKILLRYLDPIHYCIEWDWRFGGRPLVHFLGQKRR